MSEPYHTMVADPPWHFDDALPGPGRGAVKHYELMTIDDVRAYMMTEELNEVCSNDCRLFLWRVSSMQEEALSVVRAWGFVPKSEMVWLKKTKKGKRHFGMGRTVRNEHESVIIAERGHPPRLSASIRSTFRARAGERAESCRAA